MAKIVLGFSCVGKTTYVRNAAAAGGNVVQFNENEFDIDVVMRKMAEGFDVYLPITDHIVTELQSHGLYFYLVYPDVGCKQVYLAHLVRSGRKMPVVHTILKDWDKDLEKIRNISGCKHIKLGHGEYLSDKLWENNNADIAGKSSGS